MKKLDAVPHLPLRSRRTLRMAAVTAFVALQLVAVAPPAHAADITCTISGSTATVVLVDTVNGLRIKRVGDDVFFGTQGLGGQACGTVTTIDRYEIDAQQTTSVVFELEGGEFAPGFTPEANGASEIEFEISDVYEEYQFSVYGTFNRDGVVLGQRFRQLVTRLETNLNALEEEAAPDMDVSVAELPRSALVNLKDGSDSVSGQGLPGFDGTGGPATYPLSIYDEYGADRYVGGFGNDYMSGDQNGEVSKGDTFVGGEGRDMLDLTFKGRGSTITLDDVANDGENCPGNDCEDDQVASDFEHVIGTAGSDRLVGGPGAQTLDGLGGNNVLLGGPGSDVLSAGKGRDIFRGGKGTDVVRYDGHAGGVNITLDGDGNDGLSGEFDNVAEDIEAVVGSYGNDRIEGNDKANRISGFMGDDILVGRGGNDHLDLYDHGGRQEGSDVFHGGSGVDTVYANALFGPVDFSIDGVANDLAIGAPQHGTDNVKVDVENLVGGSYEDKLTGDDDPNRLVGSFGGDALVGLEGNDVLLPGAGVDTLKGGLGRDTASYTDAPVAISASLAQGTATGDGDDTLVKLERLTGSSFEDTLTGSGAENVLTGGAGADVLSGLGADDTLLGGGGGDTLNGGAGTDTCKQGPGSGPQSGCEN